MLRYRTGVANSPAAGMAMAAYLSTERLQPENSVRARYYAGEVMPEPRTLIEQYGRLIAAGEMGVAEALDQLIGREIAHGSGDPAKERLADQLRAAASRAEALATIADHGGTVAKVRPDLDPVLASRLGIDQSRPIMVGEIGNLLNGLRADGTAIKGKQVQSPMRSVAEIFGLDGKRLPTAAEVEHVLAGLTARGEAPAGAGGELPPEVVKGARGRFLAAYGAAFGHEPTVDEIEHLKGGRLISGLTPAEGDNVLGKLNATKAPIAYVDMVWSADKSVTLAWALAPTEAEAAMVLQAHRDATDEAMAYVEHRLGFTRKGKAGRDGVEKGRVAWIKFDHYTSRPTAEVARRDPDGRSYTEFRDVPMRVADPQLHTHATMLNAVMTESGRIGALDLDQLDGLVKEFGAVYQAFVAKNLRRHGIDVVLDHETGAARITAIPLSVRHHFSKRSQEGHEAAREYAAKHGLDWDTLTPEHQLSLLQRGHEETRRPKAKTPEGESDQVAWKAQAAAIGYHHRSVLRPDAIVPGSSADERRQRAYEVSLGFLEEALSRRAKLNGQELREYAARGLIEGGIDDPGQDIGAITKAYRERGVRQDGEQVALLWGKDVPVRGKERWSVTTALHETAERELIGLAGKLGADRSVALPMWAIDRAVREFLRANPQVDPESAQWRAQRKIIDRLGTGGRLGVAIGVAGAGKSTMLSPLVDALQMEGGRTVFGLAVAWRQAGALAEAGIAKDRLAAVDAFVRRVETGRYTPDRNTVVIIDELGLLGRRQMLDMLRLQQTHGFQIMAVGDPKQAQSIEAGPVIDLLQQALGPDAVPEILTTVRQRAERERRIAAMFREGRAGEALALKREDGTTILVAGGRDATIARVAELWRERAEARADDPDYRLMVSAPTNADVNAIGAAIRIKLREMGRLGEDRVVVSAAVRGEVVELPLAIGDRVRLFDRVHATAREILASNGEIIEVRELSEKGMLARNAAGREAFVPWNKLRDKDTPVRLAYGYALTIDASQGITSDEHINALPSGSQATQGFKTYVAESRHREATWMVVNEAAERRQIASRIPLGERRDIKETDVWRNIAANLSRQPAKASAIAFIKHSTGLRRGTVYSVQHGNEPGDRRQQAGQHRTAVHRWSARVSMERAPVVRRMLEQAQQIQRRLVERLGPRHRQGRGPSL
jgi:hypothetical protein